ncbi:MAG: 2-oxoglutarate and iron-dependent oxygenase domain-containing protein [Cyanobacteria bacterium J06582_2]
MTGITTAKIPIIDFAPFKGGDVSIRQAIATEVYRACHETGFMYLKNIGIDPDLIAKTMMRSQQFFDLPLTEKNKLAWSNEITNHGYVGIERERLDESKPGDLKEAYNIGKEIKSSQLKLSQSPLLANRWLNQDVVFRQTMSEFFSTCAAAANVVSEAMAIALNLPESFFVERHNQNDHTLRLLHYPPVKNKPKPEQIRAGEHSDYGSFTFLFQDAVGGLEVLNSAGEWIEAVPISETVVVNTGDLMQRWTNHVFCSTKHRVRIPADQKQEQSRYSIAYFCHPNHNVEISCLKTCQNNDRPPLYPPITAGDYLLSRLQATY